MRQEDTSGWTLRYEGCALENEASIPTLLVVGNGRVGIRGTVPEIQAPHSRGLFLAGFYDALPRPELHPDDFSPFLRAWCHMEQVDRYQLETALVNCPDVFDGWFETADERFVLDQTRCDQLVRELCVRTGEAVFKVPLATGSGKQALLARRRFARMDQDDCVYEKIEFIPTNFTGEVTYHAILSDESSNYNISGIYDTKTATRPEDAAWIQLFDVLRRQVSDDMMLLRIRGRAYGQTAELISAIQRSDGISVAANAERGCQDVLWNARQGETMTFDRVAAYSCSTLSETGRADASGVFDSARCLSYSQALKASTDTWTRLWRTSDIVIEGDPTAQLSIRHSLYQLLIACCRSSDKVSVAAKGLTGEGYRGMTFWDTDIHMLPFYLYTQPQMARNLVSFRYETLDGAKHKAKRYGFAGASYPWETGCSGEEECESFLKLITNQLHITADVAYAMGQYLDATADASMDRQAAELLLETARFWLSKGHVHQGLLHIPNASGPDELHLDCSDSAMVCNMAAWNLSLAQRAIERLQQNDPESWRLLRARLVVADQELADIDYFKTHIVTMKGEDGLYEQFAGYFGLEDRVMVGDGADDVPVKTQTVKQADVLMLLHLLPQLVNQHELLENWNYYEPRTTHTSSLSYGVHGILASKLGFEEKARYYFERSLGIDLTSRHGDCATGAHLAACGMSWSVIVNGIAGADLADGVIRIDPKLPDGWERLRFCLCYRGCEFFITVIGDRVEITLDGGPSDDVKVLVRGQPIEFG